MGAVKFGKGKPIMGAVKFGNIYVSQILKFVCSCKWLFSFYIYIIPYILLGTNCKLNRALY